MKNKKVILAGALLCAAGLCTAGLAIPASPVNIASLIQADDAAYNGFLYTVNEGNATITGYTEELDLTNVVIPDVIVEGENEYPVTAIGNNAFEDSAAVNITVSDNVTSIGERAFRHCYSLKNLKLGKNVTSIGNDALDSYTSNLITLDTLTLPDNLKSIDGNVFYCTAVKSVIIPDTVVSVPYYFTDNWSTSSFIVDENNEFFAVSEEGILFNKDFSKLIKCPRATALTEYNVPETVTEIAYGAFCECSSLETINVNDKAESIGAIAFKHCYNLKNLKLGKNVTSIGEYAIESYTDKLITLDTLTLPDNLKSIDGNVFYCTVVKSVIIPDTVVSVPYYFTDNSAITSFVVDENNEFFAASEEGILFNKDFSKLIKCPRATTLTEYNVPETVTEIAYGAFCNCTSFKTINVNDKAESISAIAFKHCYNLKNLKLGKNVTSIGEYALDSGKDKLITLDTLTLPDNLMSIDGDILYDTAVKSVIIPDTVVSVPYYFTDNWSTSSFVVDENNELYASVDGLLYNKDITKLIRCPKATDISVVIPDSVTEISENAFLNCTSLKNINIGKNVKTLGKSALAFSCEISSLTIPENIESIDSNPFANGNKDNTSYKKLIIPAGAESINPVFYNKSSLTEITVEEGCKHFACDEGILYSTDTLELLKCPVTTSLSKYDILTNTEKITSGAFSSTKIINLLIPSTVKEIEEDAFKDGSLAKIRGIAGSYAETYANENNIKFEAVDADPAKTLTATGTSGVTQPTAAPTATPTASATPTTNPTATATPSTVPTTDPTASASPSAVPTANPTAEATPSAAPTTVPTAEATPSAAPTSAPSVQKGDIDGDGAVTTTDVKNILKYIVGKIKFTEAQTAGADINGDGAVNSADALLLLRTVVGQTETK